MCRTIQCSLFPQLRALRTSPWLQLWPNCPLTCTRNTTVAHFGVAHGRGPAHRQWSAYTSRPPDRGVGRPLPSVGRHRLRRTNTDSQKQLMISSIMSSLRLRGKEGREVCPCSRNVWPVVQSIASANGFTARIREDRERKDEWFGSPTLGRSPSRHDSKKSRHRPWRGPHDSQHRSRSTSPDAKTMGLTLESRSRSPSPTKLDNNSNEYYGTTKLEQRSRSPSPSSAHSLPVQPKTRSAGVAGRSGKRRLLPSTPHKPSFLRPTALTVQSVENINFPLVSHSPTIPTRTPAQINFPKLNASPTHLTKQQPPQHNWTVTAGNGLSTLLAPLRAIGRANSSSCLNPKRASGARELPQPPSAALAAAVPIPHMPYSQSMGPVAAPMQPIVAPSSLHTWKEEAPSSFEAANAPALALITSTCDPSQTQRSGFGQRILPQMTNGFKHVFKPKRATDRPLLVPTHNPSPPVPPAHGLRSRSAGGHHRPYPQQQRPNSSMTTETVIDTQHMVDTDEEDDTDWC